MLYELQVLRDAGALLPPEVDAPLIEDLAAVAGRHGGGGELDHRGHGEAQLVRGEAQVVRLLRRVLARAWEAGPRAEVRSRDEIRSGLRELRESGDRRAPPPGGAVQGAVQGIAPHAMRKIIEVRRVVVTPTRVVALPAELDLTNRVSREFPEAPIRVAP